MIEQQTINGKEVWLKIDPHYPQRDNANIIPAEYFTASYYFTQPSAEATNGEIIKDENGEFKLFESPVAALNFAAKKLGTLI